jgi:flagellar basal-body rod modification protein FlgD
MTTVTSTSNNAAVASAVQETASSKLGADFNMFLKMLTAQMQNQDPLDPMDTAQYTQQLVQYSQVEQSITQTATLKSMLAAMGTQNLTQASSLIGRQVETGSATSGLSAATPAQWTWSAPREVASMTATFTDSNGRVVDTRTLTGGASAGSLVWDGTTATGLKKDAGNYTLAIKGVDAAGNTVEVTPHAVGKVSDVQLANGNVQVTINGMTVDAANLVRIGEAAATPTG